MLQTNDWQCRHQMGICYFSRLSGIRSDYFMEQSKDSIPCRTYIDRADRPYWEEQLLSRCEYQRSEIWYYAKPRLHLFLLIKGMHMRSTTATRTSFREPATSSMNPYSLIEASV